MRMKAEMDRLEERVPKSVPATVSLALLIEALRRQIAREEQQKAAERQERARFNVD